MTDQTSETEGHAQDPLDEIEAMRSVVTALKDLPAPSRDRVLDWALKFYRSKASGAHASTTMFAQSEPGSARSRGPGDLPDEVATLFAKANPGTEPEKALVAAYWFLKHDGVEEVDSFRLNSELTHLGHRVSNITRALGVLMTARPALVVQTRKEGKTKQARKKYKLTVEGIRRVERMLAGENTSEQ